MSDDYAVDMSQLIFTVNGVTLVELVSKPHKLMETAEMLVDQAKQIHGLPPQSVGDTCRALNNAFMRRVDDGYGLQRGLTAAADRFVDEVWEKGQKWAKSLARKGLLH